MFPSFRQMHPSYIFFVFFLLQMNAIRFHLFMLSLKVAYFYVVFVSTFLFPSFTYKKALKLNIPSPEEFGWISKALVVCRLCLRSIFCHYFQFSVAFLISVYLRFKNLLNATRHVPKSNI